MCQLLIIGEENRELPFCSVLIWLHQIPIFRPDELDEVVGGDVHLETDFASTEIDFVAKGGTFFHESGEGLLHADRGASSVDIAGERQQLFLFDHGDVLDTSRGGGFLEVQSAADGNDKNIVLARVGYRYQGLENRFGGFIQQVGDGLAVGHRVVIFMSGECNALLAQYPHYIGLFHGNTTFSVGFVYLL